MLERVGNLDDKRKAELLDGVVDLYVYWMNTPMDFLKKREGSDIQIRYGSPLNAAGYKILQMLLKEGAIRMTEYGREG